jgi:tetratricopeptide (TPR) repeat protein
VATNAGIAFAGLGDQARSADLDQIALRFDIAAGDWLSVRTDLTNLAIHSRNLNQLALSERCRTLALDLAKAMGEKVHLFGARLDYAETLSLTGQWEAADKMWRLANRMGRDWPRYLYRPGDAEKARLKLMLLARSRLTEGDFAAAESAARAGQNRKVMRELHRLRGEWRLDRGEYALAAESFQEAIRLAHEAGFRDPKSETQLALARLHLDQLPAARDEAARLSAGRNPAHLELAELWLAAGESEQAAIHAQAAYRYAWADGEPYVRRYDLDRATTLLQQLGVEIPALPAYDPAEHPRFPWESEIEAAIAELSGRGPRRRSQRV